jgi:hypothetical protein
MPTGGTQICLTQIPGRFAKQIDLTQDDGTSNTGSIRYVPDGSALATPATLPAAVDDGALYTVCKVF